jgi:hypothetical protein
VHTAAHFTLPSGFIPSLGLFVQKSVFLIVKIEQMIFVDLMFFTTFFMEDVSQQSSVLRRIYL